MNKLLPLVLLAACGGPDTQPAPDVLAQIRTEKDRLALLVDQEIYRASGDGTTFAGIISGTFPWACDLVKQAQFDDGSFARSVAHKERGDRDFSRDAAIGILWSVKAGCLDTPQVVKFVDFVNKHDCLSTQCDAKAETNTGFRTLIQHVTKLDVVWTSPVGASWLPWGQHFFNDGSELFLDYASVYLYDRSMDAKDEANPFYQFVAGDKAKAADLLLPLMRQVNGPAECYNGECSYLRWQLQWEDGEDYRPEELVWMAKLLGGS